MTYSHFRTAEPIKTSVLLSILKTLRIVITIALFNNFSLKEKNGGKNLLFCYVTKINNCFNFFFFRKGRKFNLVQRKSKIP